MYSVVSRVMYGLGGPGTSGMASACAALSRTPRLSKGSCMGAVGHAVGSCSRNNLLMYLMPA
eukprot:4808274-Alexandrium_andersonii.AAC.1